MKKHYERVCVTPLGFEFEGALLDGSVPVTMSTIQATGQEVQELDFSDNSFNTLRPMTIPWRMPRL